MWLFARKRYQIDKILIINMLKYEKEKIMSRAVECIEMLILDKIEEYFGLVESNQKLTNGQVEDADDLQYFLDQRIKDNKVIAEDALKDARALKQAVNILRGAC